jgi:hypothetical protein
MLTSLSHAQWTDVATVREVTIRRWTVEGVDQQTFTDAAVRCYAEIGRAAPLVVVAPGPVAALMYSALLRGQLGGQLSDQLRGQLRDQLDDQLRGQLRGQLRDQLSDQLRDQLDGQLGGQLVGQLSGQLSGQLRGQLRGQLLVGHLDGQQLSGQLRGQLRDQLSDQLDGQHWSGWRHAWVTHWLHINTIQGIKPAPATLTDTLAAYRTFTVPAFTIPLEGVVIALGPHLELNRNARGDLHCSTGPAWSWPDGTTIYALNGVRVPAWVVESPDATRVISDLDNAEQRRVAFDHIGWDKAISELNLTPVDIHSDPKMGRLYRLPAQLSGDDVAGLLVCENASPSVDGSTRIYGLPVPHGPRTVIEAQAALARLTPEQFLTLDGAS